MGNLKFFEDTIEQRLLDMHTAYLGVVLSTDGNTATIQPLGMYKEYGKSPQNRAVVPNVPIIQSARYKISSQEITFLSEASLSTSPSQGYVTNATLNTASETCSLAALEPLSTGSIVVCICCERDITDAKNGVNSVPALGHHSMSNSVVVGVLS